MVKKRISSAAVAAVVALSAATLSACGNSSDNADAKTNANTSSRSAGAITTPDPAYTGVNRQWFKNLDEPVIKDGTSFKVAYLVSTDEQPMIAAMQKAAETKVKELGGTFIGYSAALDPQKQASQLNQAIAQKVDAILVTPVVEEALAPGVAAAKKADIPIVVTNAPADQNREPMAGAVTTVSVAWDYQIWQTMNALAEEHPGATFATMGLGLPVTIVKFITERSQYWGRDLGLKFLGNVDAQSDSPTGYGPAASSILTKYPEVDIVLTYQDQSSMAFATAAKTAGKSIFVANPNSGLPLAQKGLEAGQLDIVAAVPWEHVGAQAAIAAYDVVTNQNLPLPKYINSAGSVNTNKSNDAGPWVVQ